MVWRGKGSKGGGKGTGILEAGAPSYATVAHAAVLAAAMQGYGSPQVWPKKKDKTNPPQGGEAEGSPAFQCLWEDCSAARSGKRTRAGEGKCFDCRRPRAKAVKPPLHSMCKRAYEAKMREASGHAAQGATAGVKQQATQQSTKLAGALPATAEEKQRVQQERRAALAQAATGADTKGNSAPPHSSAAEPAKGGGITDAVAEKLASGAAELRADDKGAAGRKRQPLMPEAEELEEMATLKASLTGWLELLEGQYMPPQMHLETKDEIVKRLLGDMRPCSRVSEAKALAEQIAAYKASLLSLPPGAGRTAVEEEMKAKLTAKAKLDKEPTDLESHASGIREALSKLESRASQRLNRMGIAVKATEASEKKEDAILNEFEAAIAKARDVGKRLHEAQASAYQARAQHSSTWTAKRLCAPTSKHNSRQWNWRSTKRTRSSCSSRCKTTKPGSKLRGAGRLRGRQGQQRQQQQQQRRPRRNSYSKPSRSYKSTRPEWTNSWHRCRRSS